MSAQPNENPIAYQSNLSDLSSFNSFGVVTLSDGQRVNVQFVMRHGIPLEKQYEDFKKYVKFLDMCAQDHEVKFWDGKKSEKAEEGQGSNGTEPKSTEPTYTKVDENGGEVLTFPAGVLTVEFKKGNPYYSVSDASNKVTKFPVRLWPEVLEKAGIKEMEVDPKTGKDLTGWTAVYEQKVDSKWPAKVVALELPEFMK